MSRSGDCFPSLGHSEPLLPLFHTFRAGSFPSTPPSSSAQGATQNWAGGGGWFGHSISPGAKLHYRPPFTEASEPGGACSSARQVGERGHFSCRPPLAATFPCQGIHSSVGSGWVGAHSWPEQRGVVCGALDKLYYSWGTCYITVETLSNSVSHVPVLELTCFLLGLVNTISLSWRCRWWVLLAVFLFLQWLLGSSGFSLLLKWTLHLILSWWQN